MSSGSWLSLKSQGVPRRYGLSKDIESLLTALDIYHRSDNRREDLAQLIRLSPKRRAAVTDAIAICAERIQKDPQDAQELQICLNIIQKCTELRKIADTPLPTQGFPLMRLPRELRYHIICLVIGHLYYRDLAMVCTEKRVKCHCPEIPRAAPEFIRVMRAMRPTPPVMGLPFNREFHRVFFAKKLFRFSCCCELKAHLSTNNEMVQNIRRIHIYWCGPESAAALQLLSTCPRLDVLKITISKFTMAHISHWGNGLKQFFPLSYKQIRLTDALGFNELVRIRGLSEVSVHHTQPRGPDCADEVDRAGLASLLDGMLRQPK